MHVQRHFYRNSFEFGKKSLISNSVFLFEVFTIKNNIKTVKLFVFCKFVRKSSAQWSKEPQKKKT